jgi:hypothetical protein
MTITINNTDTTDRNIVVETGGARDMSFARPTSAADDEYAFIAVAVDGDSTAAISWTATPSGWTQFIDYATGNGRPMIGGWYKKLTSGDTGPFVVSYAASSGSVLNGIGIIQRAIGAHASTFEDVADVVNEPSATASPIASSITTANNNAEVFYLYSASDGRFLNAVDSGYPGGVTGMFSRVASASSSSPTLAITHKTQATAGAAGSSQFSGWLSSTALVRMVTFAIREAVSAGTTDITGVSDTTPYHGQTSITVSGTNFNAAQGDGEIYVCSANDPDHVSAVNQTVTAWADTSITITAVLDSFDFDTDLYLFVRNSDEEEDTNGFVIQRSARIFFRDTNVVDLSNAGQTNISSINWRMWSDATLATTVDSGTGESVDASSDIEIGPITQGSLDPNAAMDVWLGLSVDAAAGSELAFLGKVTLVAE